VSGSALVGRFTAAIALALAALYGCATPAPAPAPVPAPAATRDDLYVLVPDPSGKTGALSVAHGADQQVLGAPYAAARIREPGRLETGVVTEAEIKEAFADALAAQPPRPVSFLLYFLEGKDELTPESRQAIRRIFAEVAGRPAPEVVVIGHTDRVGSIQFNDALSLRRAQKVRDDLVTLGIAADRIEVAGRGEREPLVPTGDEVEEPRNRRVEISVR